MSRRKRKPHTTKKPKPKRRIASTMAAAAAMTKLPMGEIRRAKASGCSAFKANGRIDCDLLVEFVATMPEVDGSEPDYFVERARDIRANRMLKEQKFQERGKLLWPIEKIKRAWARNVIATKTKLTVAENSIAVEAGMRLNLTPDQISAIKEITMKHIRAAQKEMHVGEWGKTECPNCKKGIEP